VAVRRLFVAAPHALVHLAVSLNPVPAIAVEPLGPAATHPAGVPGAVQAMPAVAVEKRAATILFCRASISLSSATTSAS
jgi:hypothetical protein